MSWDERLFGRLYAALRRRRDRRGAEGAGGAIAVAPEVARLELVASALAERRIAIVLADGDGGVRGDALVLPPALAPPGADVDGAGLLLARVALGAVVARARPRVGGGDDVRALATVRALIAARAIVERELPGAHALVERLLPGLRAARPALAASSGPARALEAAARLALGEPVDAVAAAAADVDRGWLTSIAGRGDESIELGPARGGRIPALPLIGWLGPPDLDGVAVIAPPPGERAPGGGHQRAGRARDRVRRRQLDESPAGENPLVHSFEKVHTLEKYQGGRKRVDGEDDLADHGDALDELGLDEVVRSSRSVASVYRADVLGLDEAGEVGGGAAPAGETLTYDEWDAAAGRYRPAWCVVNVDHAPPRAGADATRGFVRAALARHRRERTELAAQVARLDAQPTRVGRQPDGTDIDVDAVVERHGALCHGTTGPEKLYVAVRRRPPELAVALLVDRSLSSDAWIGDRRVLEIGTGALVALGEALDHVAARTAIVAFSSHTRRDCRLAILKGFAAPWRAAHARLAGLEPSGYTRIGPALRHVTAMLDREPARRKLLVLLSDGKPTDYDRYEGRYGVADVRKAVDEAARAGVHVFTVALDQRVRHHLPAMFGPGGFAVVSRPRDLVTALGHLYRQRLGC